MRTSVSPNECPTCRIPRPCKCGGLAGGGEESPYSSEDADQHDETAIEVTTINNNNLEATNRNEPSWQDIAVFLKTLVLSKDNTPLIAAAALLTILSVIFNYLVPLFISKAFDASSDEDTASLKNSLLFSMILFMLSQVIPHFRQKLLSSISANTTNKILSEAVKKSLLEKDLTFHITTKDEDKTHQLNKCFTVEGTIAPLLTQILPTLSEIAIASVFVSTQYDFKAGAALLLMFASSIGFGATTAKRITEASEQLMQAGRKTWGTLSETVTHHKTIHDIRDPKNRLKLAGDQMDETIKQKLALNQVEFYSNRGQVFIAGAFAIAILLFTDCTKLSKQDLFILATYLQQFVRLIPSFGETITKMMASYPDLKFVIGELIQPSQIKDHFADTPLKVTSAPSIEFKNVSFSYNSDEGKKIVLREASFRIKPLHNHPL